MNFFAMRYFIVQSSQTSLFPLVDDNIKPKDLFLFPLINRQETNYYNKKYTTRLVSANPNDNYIVGYLLKSTDTHLIQLDKELFNESDLPNWEKLFFIIDTEKQMLLVEYNTPVATPENVKNVLIHLTRKTVASNGYTVKLDFLVDKFAFWKIIQDATGIFQIAFDLSAPNLFGGTKKANEWLKTLKEKHNMTNVSVDFRNENAELLYDEEELESYRDYADSGGGNWTLGVLQNGRKKKYYSVNHLRKKESELNTDNPNYIRDNLEEVKQLLIKLLKSIDDLEL